MSTWPGMRGGQGVARYHKRDYTSFCQTNISLEAFTCRRGPFSKYARVMAHFFSFSHSLSLFLYFSLCCLRVASLDRSALSSRAFPDIASWFARYRFLHCPKSQRANRPRRITGFRSPLRAIPNNGSNGSDPPAPRAFSSFRPHLTPRRQLRLFLSSMATSLLRRDLRPLRFNLTRHYYVFHRDFSLVKFRSHNPDSSSFPRARARALTIHLLEISRGNFPSTPLHNCSPIALYKSPETNIPSYFRSIIDEPWKACKDGRLRHAWACQCRNRGCECFWPSPNSIFFSSPIRALGFLIYPCALRLFSLKWWNIFFQSTFFSVTPQCFAVFLPPRFSFH